MKTRIFLMIFTIASFNVSIAQKNIQISTKELMFLVDITDTIVYRQIHSDFIQSLSTFFQNTGMGKIEAEECFTLSVAPINATGELQLTSASIEILRKGMSYNDEAKLKNPRPLLNMLNAKLAEYDLLSKNNHTQSCIFEIILKAISQTTADETVITICSDLMEYSNIYSMYKKIPPVSEMSQIMANIDPVLLKDVKGKLKSGNAPNIVIVLKKTGANINYNELKTFWVSFFNHLGISDIKFIDNFSQNPQI
ncbi:hypothetical protein LJB85_02375 [Porphyromonadaceae bacterium OttesenSCG-928-L07]|nr:hypothetical protein [Porphyromonadaceae bacterium OttesenSCG-928-L07]